MSITTDRAVFLDFDGVLFDTIREVYAVSMIALDSSTNIKDINFDSKHFEKFVLSLEKYLSPKCDMKMTDLGQN